MTGVLLINVGTPDAPEPKALRRYLRQFLMDPWVVDLPYPLRWLLVHALILPTRPKKSAEAYQQIWTEEGSPLLVHTRGLATLLGEELGSEFRIEVGMAVGNPSIASGLEKLIEAGASRLVVLPLFPQYSLATTHGSLEIFEKAYAKSGTEIPYEVIHEFHAHPEFIRAWMERISEHLNAYPADHLLLSFHGLPVRHLTKTPECAGHCYSVQNCCELAAKGTTPAASRCFSRCYRAQAHATARHILEKLQWPLERATVSFQSRLGHAEWIAPYTEKEISRLATGGVRRVAVACPSFVADCLETLEEIGIRAKEQFEAEGGDELSLIPCLNEQRTWVGCAAQLVRGQTPKSSKT